jgi:CheY-like chemotaxis protein
MGQSSVLPFENLDHKINVLIVDDDEQYLNLLDEVIAQISIYKVHKAKSGAEALTRLRSGVRFHSCILDLGIMDIEHDEFYFLRQYANHCSIIVVTGSQSPSRGATCIQLGARAVVEKGVQFDHQKFIEQMNYFSLVNVVNHRFTDNGGDTLSYATKILIDKSPQTVTEWADYMRITDRQLRNLWHEGCGFGAKHILFLYHFLSSAFQYHMVTVFGTQDEKKMVGQSALTKKLNAFYETHSDIINFILS